MPRPVGSKNKTPEEKELQKILDKEQRKIDKLQRSKEKYWQEQVDEFGLNETCLKCKNECKNFLSIVTVVNCNDYVKK